MSRSTAAYLAGLALAFAPAARADDLAKLLKDQPKPQPPVAAPAAMCHYSYSVWNVKLKKSAAWKTVAKPYAKLTAEEKGPLGCTPCLEDQQDLALSNGLTIKACVKVAAQAKKALEASLSQGQTIKTLVGYRPQLSRGAPDAEGNLTVLSNHSFGVAFDVNENFNGLYNNCPAWSSKCVLAVGGPYLPGSPLSLVASSPAVVEMGKAGLQWGGTIAGGQKDFMHFSPTGY